ncbi:unnamed protein product [Clonostachys rhizophaga]|uniref:von Willebrand factor A domain-containing protein 5A n=1 Tax=Clonostachys rhizophaga TaxID=160324 RepID=A0A9N9V705_9HYPO|nr:unnamed protein product [Clonostachys rhizophaga]
MAMGASRAWTPLCGCYILVDHKPMYLPHVMVDIHATILDTISHTTLTQTFINPSQDVPIEEVKYIFPLFDGVSVTVVSCIVGGRTITGVVKERQKAKKVYEEAKALGKTAGLFEQSLEAADVFFTSVGNVPTGGEVTVVITYLGELKHDAEIDGVRLTIPTRVVPRYGNSTIKGSLVKEKGMTITVDVEMPEGSTIKSLQSPSHPISIHIGKLSTEPEDSSEPSLSKASATLTRDVSALDKDFIIEVVATKLCEPSAFLETHPTIPDQRALMVSLAPKFRLSSEKPEVIFICDRSGSMGGKIQGLVNALHIFLKSLPVGVKFNIASFGSTYSFLWPRSKTYDQESLDEATEHINTFSADYGGTEIYPPMESAFQRQYKDMNLEVFLLTDGDIWDQDRLFKLIRTEVTETKGKTRIFSLGIGSGASSSLIEGVARVGNGFAQYIQDGEKMDKKLMRMLKGALLPHVSDYSLEIKYESEQNHMQLDDEDEDEGFEVIEYVLDSLHIDTSEPSSPQAWPAEPRDNVPLFDSNFDKGDHTVEASGDNTIDKYQHLPQIDTPRYLQTPTEIPTLYPFSRTNVYILLSESTPQRKIKSVFLTGTSQQANLTLEIPVVNLTRESTTIHQLAARKEIKELEEGRGWLTKAKDSDGELLKNKLDGRFSDMLEREAVRLGLQFQVSGKWCSFVAVEGLANEEADGKGKQRQRNQSAKSSGSSPMGVAKATVSTWGAAPRKQLASKAARKSAPSVTPVPVKRPRKQLANKTARKSAPSTAPVPTVQRGKGLGVGGPLRHRRIATFSEPMEDDGEQADSETGSPDKRVTSDGLESPARKRTKRTATIDPSNKLQALISLQTFSGTWLWGSSLEKVLGITAERVLSMKLPASVLKHARKEDILATVCAVAFLKKFYPGDKESWEMLVDKAEESVKSQIGDDLYKLEKILKALF